MPNRDEKILVVGACGQIGVELTLQLRKIYVETLDGKVNVKVKPETQNGTKIKLKGKGYPVYKKEGEFGDLYITYSIKIPTLLTARQRELFTELSKLK